MFGNEQFIALHGMFLSVTSGTGDSLFWSLRARDVSGSVLPDDPIRASLATEIPLVPETEFRSEVHLLNVPFAPTVEKRLRIYALGTAPVRVLVKAYTIGWSAGSEVRSAALQLSAGQEEDGFPSYPGFADLDLGPLVNGLTESWGPRIGITVEAEDDARIWALVLAATPEESTLAVVTPRR
ncbi:MAG TPA: hypothetical protein VF701_12275 [Thermoanaerobaculia bacterium]